jgi:hypothetical protein
MLKLVLGRLLFLSLRDPSMLPSREPESLVLRVSGSANITEEFRLGEGGALMPAAFREGFTSPVAFANRLCSLDLDRSVGEPPLSSEAPAKGLNMFTRLVGIEGAHLAKVEILEGSEGFDVATVAIARFWQQRCTRELRAKGHSCRGT